MKDEDDERDGSNDVDIDKLKKFKSRLPKIKGRRDSRDREADRSLDRQSSLQFNHSDNEITEKLHVTPGKPTDIHIPDTPGSGSGGSDSERRLSNRKKSKFQRMLEKAREEEKNPHRKKKPLFLRLQEKALADSDNEEKLRLEKYMHNAERKSLPKNIRLPKLAAKIASKGSASTPSLSAAQGQKSSIGMKKPSPAIPRRNSGDSKYKFEKYKYDKFEPDPETPVKKKKKPLYLRMNEMAAAAEELAEKSKMELYNQQKLERRAAHAPSKEEIKHRITEGLARRDENQDSHQQRNARLEADKENLRVRKKRRDGPGQYTPVLISRSNPSPTKKVTYSPEKPNVHLSPEKEGRREVDSDDAGYQGDSDGDGIKKRIKGLKSLISEEAVNIRISSKDSREESKIQYPETRITDKAGYMSNTDKSEDSGSLRSRKKEKTPPSKDLTGAAWLAEVLSTDENEEGLVMMYNEGFSMIMAEQGLIPDSDRSQKIPSVKPRSKKGNLSES